MDKYCTCSSSKRAHVETGTTPNKPDKKRSTPVRGTSRKGLFSDGIDQTDRTPLAEVTRKKSPSILTRLRGLRKSPKSPKQLFVSKKTRIIWQRKEDVALVQFVALHRDLQPTTSEWPSLNSKSSYWENASKYIQEVAGTSYLREGSSVRQRVVVFLKGKFNTVDDAEEEYGLSVESYLGEAAENVEPQSDSIPVHLLTSVDHLGQSQLEVVIAKASSKYVYVPEVDPITGETPHERADHNHLLKRMVKHTRDGGNPDLTYERFDEAMRDPKTGLTHAALVGTRKQPINGIIGFSRETVVEVTTNIESQEFRRRQNAEIGFEENPRGSSTDDLECFYSMCHGWLGPVLTLKEFKTKWRKIVREFSKRMDPELPFFCHTLNERFSTDLLPSFDEAPIECNESGGDNDDETDSRHQFRLHRLIRNTREDSSIFAAGRSFLPARNRVSTRQRFHRFDIGLPPLL